MEQWDVSPLRKWPSLQRMLTQVELNRLWETEIKVASDYLAIHWVATFGAAHDIKKNSNLTIAK